MNKQTKTRQVVRIHDFKLNYHKQKQHFEKFLNAILKGKFRNKK